MSARFHGNRCVTVAASLVTVAVVGAANANGTFPSSGQVVVDPSDPTHVLVRTTYGILTTRDGGGAWDWICEEAFGYGGGYHPPIAVTGDGSLLAALTDGVGVSPGGQCDVIAGAGGIAGNFVVDLSVDRTDTKRAIAITTSGIAGPRRVWESVDHGTSWSPLGAELPSDLFPQTIDHAESDTDRIYASGLAGQPGDLVAVLARSDDRGQTWALQPLPAAESGDTPYIGAVHPVERDWLFVRSDADAGRLLLSIDGGIAWTTVFEGIGFLRGFALSPDGTTVLVGGEDDGIWRAPTDALAAGERAFEKISTVSARCLAWSAAGVHACGSEYEDGFALGLSTDGAESFRPVMHAPCVRGPLDCASATTAGEVCPAAWPSVRNLIDAASCAGSGGGGSAGSGAGGSAGASTTGPAGSGGGVPDPAAVPGESDGCGCRTASAGSPTWLTALAVAAGAALVRRARSSNRRARLA